MSQFAQPDELLDGLTPAQINTLFTTIQRRATHFIKLSTYALRVLLEGTVLTSPNLAVDELWIRNYLRLILQQQRGDYNPSTSGMGPYHLTADHLERTAPYWATLIPKGPTARAALAWLIAQHYNLHYGDIPQIRSVLGLDDVSAIYQTRYGQSIASAFNKTSPDLSATSQGVQFMLDSLRAELDWETLTRGDVLFEEGASGDALYIVVSGLLQIQRQSSDTINKVGQGQVLGEMALLSQELRSATVTALRDTILVRLNRIAFQRLSILLPNLTLPLVQTVIQRFRATNSLKSSFIAVRTILVLPLDHSQPEFSKALVSALQASGDVLHLNSAMLDHQAFTGATEALTSPHERPLLTTWLNEQEAVHQFIVYEADPADTPWTRQCITQADHIILVAEAGSHPQSYAVEKLIADASQLGTKIDLALLHPRYPDTPQGTHAWLEARQFLNRHYHVALQHPPTIQRIARFLTGRAIGIVFGGGGSRGFAHIGVMRALQELGIPIDAVGGTSAGSMLAGFAATQRDHQEGLQKGVQLFSNFVDMTLPLISLAAGKRLTEGLKDLFGPVRIEDLWIEFFCISTNYSKSVEVVHRHGPLWRALRASASIPGVFPPVIADNEDRDILIDGAVFNNVPTNVMAESGVGFVFAVDVSRESYARRSPFNHGDSLSGYRYLFNQLNPLRRKRIKAPSLTSVQFRTIFMHPETEIETNRRFADVYLEPDLKGFDALKTDEAHDIAQVGYETAKAALSVWLQAHPEFQHRG